MMLFLAALAFCLGVVCLGRTLLGAVMLFCLGWVVLSLLLLQRAGKL